jgi:hypothetical protein
MRASPPTGPPKDPTAAEAGRTTQDVCEPMVI